MMNPEDQRTSCPGFLDDYGIWNNGFECPPLGGQIHVCCGSESRRYCCTLDNLYKNSDLLNRPEKDSYATTESSLFLIETKSSTNLTLPILVTCVLILILIFLFILISLFFWCRNRSQNDKQKREAVSSTKTNLLTEHFPFAPPHHQFLNENNVHYNNNTPLLHHQPKDTLTTTTVAPSTTTSSSSTSGRVPSDIYFNDWKDFLISGEQPMNLYPTMPSHNKERKNDYQYRNLNYSFYAKRQQHDDVV